MRGNLQEVSDGTEDTGKSSTGTSDVVDGSVGGDLERTSLGDGSRWGVSWLGWVDWLWLVGWLDLVTGGLDWLWLWHVWLVSALNDPGGLGLSRVGLAAVGEGGWALWILSITCSFVMILMY